MAARHPARQRGDGKAVSFISGSQCSRIQNTSTLSDRLRSLILICEARKERLNKINTFLITLNQSWRRLQEKRRHLFLKQRHNRGNSIQRLSDSTPGGKLLRYFNMNTKLESNHRHKYASATLGRIHCNNRVKN